MISFWVCAALFVVAQVEESSAAPTGKISLLYYAVQIAAVFEFRASFVLLRANKLPQLSGTQSALN